MFNKKDTSFNSSFDTIIGVNTTFEGIIKSEGTIRVDGKLKGDITIEGDAFIGSSASVTGNISANNVHLSGSVEGNIHAKGMLKLLSTARLYGDIQVNSFVADEGGIFQGKCSMFEASAPHSDTESDLKVKSGKEYKKSTILSDVAAKGQD